MYDKKEDYRKSHMGASKPKEYDPQFWIPGATNHLFWQIERQILLDIMDCLKPRPKRALDFACGTGRVLSFLEGHVPETVGVDISGDMLKLARHRCQRSQIIEGDVTTNPDLLTGKFDLITAFRFFLNAQPELRQNVLAALRRVLADEGILVANFHLNPKSITGSYLRFRHWLKGSNRAMMSLKEAKDLLESSGYKPVEIRGYGYLFHRRKQVRFLRLRGPLEKALAKINPYPEVALNFIVAARLR